MKRILAFLPAVHEFARCVYRGAREEASRQKDCAVVRVRVSASETIEKLLADDTTFGAIAFITKPDTDLMFSTCGKPVINVSGFLRESICQRVAVDNVAAGQKAAEHLFSRGYGNLAYIGPLRSKKGFVVDRMAGCRLFAEAHGCFFCAVDSEEEGAIASLADLSWPLGITACYDSVALATLDTLLECNIQIPGQAAIIGIDDSRDICEGGEIPLSIVSTAGDLVGQAAIKALLDSAATRNPSRCEIRIPPGRVIARRSTDASLSGNGEVNKAIHFIRLNALRGITVTEVVDALGISQAALYRHFKEAGRQSPHREIRVLQMEHAKSLLLETESPLRAICDRCGFTDLSYFVKVFKKEFGKTPTEFREARPVP